MLFFDLTTSRSASDLMSDLARCSAGENHHPLLSFWDHYTDPRIGVHTYIEGNRVRGYYENGSMRRIRG